MGLGSESGLEMPMACPSAVVKRSRCPGGGRYILSGYIGALPLPAVSCRAAAAWFGLWFGFGLGLGLGLG